MQWAGDDYDDSHSFFPVDLDEDNPYYPYEVDLSPEPPPDYGGAFLGHCLLPAPSQPPPPPPPPPRPELPFSDDTLFACESVVSDSGLQISSSSQPVFGLNLMPLYLYLCDLSLFPLTKLKHLSLLSFAWVIERVFSIAIDDILCCFENLLRVYPRHTIDEFRVRKKRTRRGKRRRRQPHEGRREEGASRGDRGFQFYRNDNFRTNVVFALFYVAESKPGTSRKGSEGPKSYLFSKAPRTDSLGSFRLLGAALSRLFHLASSPDRLKELLRPVLSDLSLALTHSKEFRASYGSFLMWRSPDAGSGVLKEFGEALMRSIGGDERFRGKRMVELLNECDVVRECIGNYCIRLKHAADDAFCVIAVVLNVGNTRGALPLCEKLIIGELCSTDS